MTFTSDPAYPRLEILGESHIPLDYRLVGLRFGTIPNNAGFEEPQESHGYLSEESSSSINQKPFVRCGKITGRSIDDSSSKIPCPGHPLPTPNCPQALVTGPIGPFGHAHSAFQPLRQLILLVLPSQELAAPG